ncbi:hypothetical protein ACJRO7_001916 [Eucalyptus globulus]|uniref:Uncharacterized protein n=1 Tax=Eucalyptus globulus TaxID=34317 RepID=A0ABD3LSK2_EUCGL
MDQARQRRWLLLARLPNQEVDGGERRRRRRRRKPAMRDGQFTMVRGLATGTTCSNSNSRWGGGFSSFESKSIWRNFASRYFARRPNLKSKRPMQLLTSWTRAGED